MPTACRSVSRLVATPEGEPVLFIMGLGAQMTLWPEALLDHYADEGYYVIRFDNRDIGLSSHLKDRLDGHPVAMMARSRVGLPIPAPYTLRDMAADAVGVLDALGLGSAHLVGVSMGGMISQVVASVWPERVRSATLIMTSTNSPRLPMPRSKLIWRLAGIGAKGHDEAAVVARSLEFWKVIQSPAFPPDEEDVRARLIRDYRRSYHPAGILRADPRHSGHWQPVFPQPPHPGSDSDYPRRRRSSGAAGGGGAAQVSDSSRPSGTD